MVHIGTELLGGEFPVTLEHPSMHPADYLSAARTAIEVTVHVPQHVAQVVAEARGAFMPVAEHQAVVGLDSGHLLRTPLTLIEFTAIAVFLVRYCYQLAADVIAPAVIGASEGACVATIGAADAHPAMTALIEKGAQRAVLLPDYQHGILGHVGREEITRLLKLALMTQVEP